jgi:hypothetical protein
MNPLRHHLAALALALLATSAAAQSVWRCDDAGRVVYQGEPCAGGRAIGPAAARPADAEAEAQQVATRERALALKLARERRQREAEPVALAAGILNPPTTLSPPEKPRLQTKRPPKPGADARTWRATVPASRRKPG